MPTTTMMTAPMSLVALHQQSLPTITTRTHTRRPRSTTSVPLKRQQIIAILDEALDIIDDTFATSDFPVSAFASNGHHPQASN